MRISSPPGHEFANPTVVEEIKVVTYQPSDLVNTVLSVPVEAGTFVTGVGHIVETAFTGGTPAIKIGDSGDDDCYGAAAAFSPTTPGNFVMNASGPKYYSGLDAIRVTHAAGLTGGKGKVFVRFFRTSGDWRVPDL